MIYERTLREIFCDINDARSKKLKLKWTPEELALDMLTTARQMQEDLEKYLNTGQRASAKRIRIASKVIETLGKSFRVQSVKSH